MNRRSFLKLLGVSTAAVVAAPLLAPTPVLARPAAPVFIPPQRLDFGVPREIVTAEGVSAQAIRDLWQQQVQRTDTLRAAAEMRDSVPMLLRQGEYLPRYGGRLAAGATVMVDPVTADRWIANRIAVPGLAAPRAMQEHAARVLATPRKDRRVIRQMGVA